MDEKIIPNLFFQLKKSGDIDASEILNTADGFWMIHKPLSEILKEKEIYDFLNCANERLLCDRFFDDWFLYAVPSEEDYTYSLLKLREQEHDAEDGSPADGDTPGVTISFISFDGEKLTRCLLDPTDENRKKLNTEINRVVAYKGQRHHNALKRYFKNPQSEGSYLVADTYINTMAAFVEGGCLTLPQVYKDLVQQSISYKESSRFSRLPHFIKSLNEQANDLVCDDEKIFIKNKSNLSENERLAILATHTGNTSLYSFAAEVEYHARFLTPLAKIKIPFFGRSVYDSAIRADMTVGDTEFQGTAPFYKANSKIVKRQYALHHQDFNLLSKQDKIK